MLISVICLSLCACGACNCGCCEKAAAEAAEEAAVVETVPEEAQSQEEKLTELLVSEDWVDLYYYNYQYDTADTRYTFLRYGYGTFDTNGEHDDIYYFQWALDDNKLLVMMENIDSSSVESDLYIFDEEQGVFTQKLYDVSIHNYTEEIALIPASRLAEFE